MGQVRVGGSEAAPPQNSSTGRPPGTRQRTAPACVRACVRACVQQWRLLLMAQRLWDEKVATFSAEDDDTERRRFWLGLSDTPEMDNQGRVLLNPVLREGAHIQRDVVLLGVGTHFEVWDSATLGAHKQAVRQRKRGGGAT